MSSALSPVVAALINHQNTLNHENSLSSSSSSLSFSLPFTNKLQQSIRIRRSYNAPQRRAPRYHLTGRRPFFTTVMEWQDCSVKLEVDVPTSVAYKCYSDREAIPQWMPFISSVKNFEDKPDLSQWSLKYTAFGRDIEFSWLSRNLQPTPNQKIHWRSLEGLPNRGAVRFFPKGADACTIELTVSYEVPQLLAPVASALQPFLENLLLRGLERFAKFAKTYSAEPTT